MGKQIINGDVEITGQLLKGDYKALYHLGAYDSVDTSNANYDVITRGTGYLNAWEANFRTDFDDSLNLNGDFPCRNPVDLATPITATNMVGNGLSNRFGTWTANDDYQILQDNDPDFRFHLNGCTTIAQAKAWLQSNNVVLEYQLSSTYTEKVLKNRPLSTLDQNGENWLRGEYEKQLNLLDVHNAFSFVNASASSDNTIVFSTPNNSSGDIKVQLYNNGTFVRSLANRIVTSGFLSRSFTKLDTFNEIWMSFSGNSQDGFARYKISGLETGATYSISMNITYSSTGSSLAQVMLNEGDHALPYQPYNGKVMHEADIKPSQIAFFHSNGSQLVPYGSGLPSGCYLSCQGSFELDLNSMVIRFKMSLWTHGTTTGLSSAEFRMFTPAQLLSLINLPYSFDSSRGTLGMWHYNNTNDNPSYTNFGTCFHIIADDYYSASRAYDVNSAGAIGAWGMKELFEGTNGISVDFVMPII